MTYAQKIMDERKLYFTKGHEEGLAKGEMIGETKTSKKYVLALKGILDPAVIAKQFELPLEEVLEILAQED